MAGAEDTDLRDAFAELGEVRLHYVEVGDGPLVVLLHGFPEFWFSWRFQLRPLAAAGFRVVAPDMRGYNLSSKPSGVAAYDADRLANDVQQLIHERGAERAFVTGHDWGGAVAWWTAMHHPEVVDRLAILNAPHPRRLLDTMRDPRQLASIWYMAFFQVPGLPERLARAGNWRWWRSWLAAAASKDALTPRDVERYVEAWAQPGAATATINYYRAALRQTPKRALARLRPLLAPTLVICGERDRYMRTELAEPDRADVPNLERVALLPNASHWVQQDEPEHVLDLLVEFFTVEGQRPPQGRREHTD